MNLIRSGRNSNKCTEPFLWRQSGGEWISVKVMETRHIYWTLVMIWNHSAPEVARLPIGNRYTHFAPEYTPQYMLKAFHELMREFYYRNDRQHGQVETLEAIERLRRLHKGKMVWHIRKEKLICE